MPPKFPFRMFFGINLIRIRNYLKIKIKDTDLDLNFGADASTDVDAMHITHTSEPIKEVNGPKLNHIYVQQ